MKMTRDGLLLIKEFEGFRARAYRDPIGVWTIGYGHTSMAGPPQVVAGLAISEAEGERILARDVDRFADGVRAALKRAVTDQQFSALVSFAYNVGLGNFRSSSVLKAVNAGDMGAVPRRLQLWNKAGGRVLPGLVRRRAAEAALFFLEGDPSVEIPPDVTPEKPAGKPVAQSKTLWAALAAMLLAVMQGVLDQAGVIVGLVLVLAVLALLGFIMRERWLKLKEEAL
jgi:lysozyme